MKIGRKRKRLSQAEATIEIGDQSDEKLRCCREPRISYEIHLRLNGL
jgi:hypothetical protein